MHTSKPYDPESFKKRKEANFDSETIPFLKLPLNVRRLIYEFWVEPFRDPEEKEMICSDLLYKCGYRCHPLRKDYEMSILMHRFVEGDIFEDQHTHSEDYETLYSLSNTNHQIRAEPKSNFYLNTFGRTNPLSCFLKARPRSCNGIRGSI
jgi:hypothetical protein